MIEQIKWPIAVVLIVVACLLIFRKSIAKLVDRIGKISKDGVELNSNISADSPREQISVDLYRGDDYERLRIEAKERICILGVGMTTLDQDELDNFKRHLDHCNIDILMLHPEHLETSVDRQQVFNSFFDKADFYSQAKSSFDRLKAFAESQNQARKYKVRFRAFSHFQTFNMVMIDPGTEHCVARVEFYTYQSNTLRPSLLINRSDGNDSFLTRLKNSYDRIWDEADRIIE